MLALGLALGAALAWGTADFLGGQTTRRLPVLGVLLVSQGFGLAVVALLVSVTADGLPAAAELAYGVLAGLALALGLGALYQGMAVGVMSIVSPISAAGAVIPIAVDLVRSERPSPVQGAGVAAALAGVALVSRGAPPGPRGGGTAGVGLGLVAAAGFGAFFVGIDQAAGAGVLWATAAQRTGVLAAVLVVLAVVRTPLAVPRGLALPLVAIGALDLAATMLFAAGTREGLTGLVSVIASLYPAATIALAFVVLGERLDRVQVAGAGGVLAGVALIAAG